MRTAMVRLARVRPGRDRHNADTNPHMENANMAKVNRISKKVVLENGIRFEFANGVTRTCLLDDLTPSMVTRFAIHGIAQKGGDSYASAESIAEAIDNLDEVWTNAREGNWEVRTGGGGILVEALARATGKPIDEARAVVRGMDDKAKRKLGGHPDILDAIAAIRKERATDAPDLADLF